LGRRNSTISASHAAAILLSRTLASTPQPGSVVKNGTTISMDRSPGRSRFRPGDLQASGNVLLYRCSEGGGYDYANLYFDNATMKRVKIFLTKAAKTQDDFLDQALVVY